MAVAGTVHGRGVEGLTRDKTRKPGKRPLLAKAAGVSLRSLHRIFVAHHWRPPCYIRKHTNSAAGPGLSPANSSKNG